MKTKRVIYITNPSLKVKEKRNKLIVGNEEIPTKEVIGVVFIHPTLDEEPGEFFLRKTPTVIFTNKGLGHNLPTAEISEDSLTEAYRRVCNLIGNEMQRFFRRYLIRRGAGYTVLKRGRYRNYYIREHKYFDPIYRECISQDLKTVKKEIRSYLGGFKALHAQIATWATAFLYANALGISTPRVSALDLILLYAIPVYYLCTADEIKTRTFVFTRLSEIPPRGQIYTALNYLIEDSNFLTFFVYNLTVAKRFLKAKEQVDNFPTLLTRQLTGSLSSIFNLASKLFFKNLT